MSTYYDFLDILKSSTYYPWAIYSAANWNSSLKTIPDSSKNNRNAAQGTGTITKTEVNGYGASASIPAISGSVNSSLTFPSGSLPTNYTICTITRYNTSSNQNRILQGGTGNYLFGHHGGNGGRVYSNNTWLTNSMDTTYRGYGDWIVTCATNGGSTPTNVYINGSSAGIATGGSGNNSNLCINANGSIGEKSDWSFCYLIIWDQALSSSQLLIVSKALNEYLSIGTPLPTGVSGSIVGSSNPLLLDAGKIKDLLDHQNKVSDIVDTENRRLLAKKTSVDSAIDSQKRILELNDSIKKRHAAYIKILLIIVAALVIFLILVVTQKSFPIIPSLLYDLVVVIIFSVALIYATLVYIDIASREKTEHDRIYAEDPNILGSGSEKDRQDAAAMSGDLLGTLKTSLGWVCNGPDCCSEGTTWCGSQNECIGNTVYSTLCSGSGSSTSTFVDMATVARPGAVGTANPYTPALGYSSYN